LSAAILELQGKVLPMETDTIRVAERVRGRLMGYFERNGCDIPAMVHGKDERGAPLREKHKHLFILPRASQLGRIDHVLLFTTAEEGFADHLADAIAQTKRVIWIEPMRAVASWMGRNDDTQIRPLARLVRSSTPFITVRHWRKGRGSMEEFIGEDIRRECRNHGLPDPIKVMQRHSLRPERFRRNRESDPSLPGYDVEITFDREVRTPLALGYGCHFGLGQFEKV
jgi:CRISPR-associated protein Csb2